LRNYILFIDYKAMKLGFKKWFSILGLLAAIIISLGIGTYFDLSILEGMTPGEEEGATPGEEEEELLEEEEEEEELLLEEGEEEEEIEYIEEEEEEEKKTTNDNEIESFSLIRNF
jgi:hypothetical protein